MKKGFAVFCLFYMLILNAQKNKDLTMIILNKKIIENQKVDFVLKNNSEKNYYILIDTLFLADAKYDNNYFFNPYFVLKDRDNNEVPKISNILESNYSADSKTINQSLILLEIKPKGNLYFKIGFKVERNIDSKQTNLFLVDRKKKYNAVLQYKLTDSFVNMNYIKRRIDVLKKNNYNVYLGTIVSNEIPVFFDN